MLHMLDELQTYRIIIIKMMEKNITVLFSLVYKFANLYIRFLKPGSFVLRSL